MDLKELLTKMEELSESIRKLNERKEQLRYTAQVNHFASLAEMVSLDGFNSLFPDARMVILPKYMLAIGFRDSKFYTYQQSPDILFCRKWDILPYWVHVIHRRLHRNSYYVILNLSDGYGERMPIPTKSVEFYNASHTQFMDSMELVEDDPQRFPLLHMGRYVFCFSNRKMDPYSLPFPDWYYIQGITQRNIEEAKRFQVPWSQKQNRCVWRGNLENGDVFAAGCDRNMRREYVRLCEKGLLPNAEYPAESISIADQIRYKYLLDINGWTTTWDAFPWKMASGSVVLKVEGVWEQWYYKYLKAGVHYVPVKRDLSDLNEMIQWCMDHDEECQKIAEASQVFVETFILSDRVVLETVEAVLHSSSLSESAVETAPDPCGTPKN